MGLRSKAFSRIENEVLELLKACAIIIDLRNPDEFSRGCVEGSLNIRLQEIEDNSQKILDLNQAIVFCCAAGLRSGKATTILKKKGLTCLNGGSWSKLNSILSQLENIE
jgi:phage shock protein E